MFWGHVCTQYSAVQGFNYTRATEAIATVPFDLALLYYILLYARLCFIWNVFFFFNTSERTLLQNALHGSHTQAHMLI